jgi:hypothetical protein
MGKQNRRKQRNRSNTKDGTSNDEDKSDDKAKNPASIMLRLRHVDPKIRHASMVALQTTLLHPTNKRVNIQVIQAVREHVMDSNLECASAAAECLVLYLNIASDNNNSNEHNLITASWTLILIGRLENCHQGIQDNKSKSIRQWYALAVPCLQALFKLIETNELALERMNTKKDTFLSTLFALLGDVQSFQATTADEKLKNYVMDTAIFTARTLHSSLDENDEMVGILDATTNSDMWTSSLSSPSSSLPDLAQLHLAGCVVTVYQIMNTSSPRWQQCLISCALPLLLRFLKLDEQQLQTLEDNYKQAKALWDKQKTDDELEQEVVRAVETRQEPSKDIARRQKEHPREKKSAFELIQDGRETTETALSAWNSVLMPAQLALEVSANLLGCLFDAIAQDGDDAMALERDEAMSLSLLQALVACKLPDSILQMLEQCGNFKKNRIDGAEILQEDLEETMSKISACLANCVQSNVIISSNNNGGSTATATATHILWESLKLYASEEGVCSVMVVVMQRDASVRQQLLLSSDLDMVLQDLLMSPKEELQRDAVSLLAAAVTGSTSTTAAACPADVMMKLTSSLLGVLKNASTSAAVTCEVLNALMDIYGQDDHYRDTFTSINVLGEFQKSISVLQKRQELELDQDEEEILFNAERFVEYKQGM